MNIRNAFHGGHRGQSPASHPWLRIGVSSLCVAAAAAASLKTIQTQAAKACETDLQRPAAVLFVPPPHRLTAWIEAQQAWLKQAIDSPSRESSSGVEIHILGIAHHKPVNCKLVSDAMRAIQPDVVASEMPDDTLNYFLRDEKIGDQLDSQLQMVAAAPWETLGRCGLACNRVLAPRELESWCKTLLQCYSTRGDPDNIDGVLPMSEVAAACRGAEAVGVPHVFVDCGTQSGLYRHNRHCDEDAHGDARLVLGLCSTPVPLSHMVEAGLGQSEAAELRQWVSTHPSLINRHQMAHCSGG